MKVNEIMKHDKFDQIYQSIISEAKFESKKCGEKETIN